MVRSHSIFAGGLKTVQDSVEFEYTNLDFFLYIYFFGLYKRVVRCDSGGYQCLQKKIKILELI